jgi:acetyltransferase-like isoleucine patch superfamily enzyme
MHKGEQNAALLRAAYGTPVGEDVRFDDYVEFKRPLLAQIGNHVAIDSFFYCSTQITIKDYVHIGPHVSVIGGAKDTYLSLGEFSFLAAGSRVICGSEDYTAGGLMGATIPMKYRAPIKLAPVIFEPFSGVGSNTVVMPGVTLAMGSMVGAGAVVTKSTEPWCVYVGSPAKMVKLRTPEDIAKTLQYARELGYEFNL